MVICGASAGEAGNSPLWLRSFGQNRWVAYQPADEPNRQGSRRLPLMLAIWMVLSAAIFVGALVEYRVGPAHRHFHWPGWLWVLSAVGDASLVFGLMWAAGLFTHGRTPPSLGAERLTGQVLYPNPMVSTASASSTGGWRWTGGASVPVRIGRLNASSPLATLDLDPGGLTLRVAGGRLFGAKPLTMAATDGGVCFPLSGLIARRGIAIRPSDQRAWYFWTKSGPEMLATLAAAGFTVSWEERKPRWW